MHVNNYRATRLKYALTTTSNRDLNKDSLAQEISLSFYLHLSTAYTTFITLSLLYVYLRFSKQTLWKSQISLQAFICYNQSKRVTPNYVALRLVTKVAVTYCLLLLPADDVSDYQLLLKYFSDK